MTFENARFSDESHFGTIPSIIRMKDLVGICASRVLFVL